jgi:hypothetical protein
MVGLENNDEAAATAEAETRFQDPELTAGEMERLSQYQPITTDDVLCAHEFIQNLGSDWTRFIPPEIRERCIGSEME